MQNKEKAKQMCTFLMGGAQALEGVLHLESQDLKLLLGSTDMGVVSPGKQSYMSLTFGHWAMCHRFLPHVGWGGVFSLGWSGWSCYFV
jgi:hypothetical protein